MNILPFIHFFVVIIALLMTGYILFKDHRAALNRLASSVFLFVAVWNFCHIFLHNQHVSEETAMLFADLSALGYVPLFAFYFWLTLTFTQKQTISKSLWFYILISVIPGGFIYIQIAHHALISSVQPTDYGWGIEWANTIFTHIFYICFIGVTSTSIVLLVRYWIRAGKKIVKKQAKIILLASMIPLVYGSCTDILFPMFNMFPSLPETGNISIMIATIGILYAMEKYKLFELTPSLAAKNIIDTMSDALFMLSNDGTIIKHNNAALALLEIEQEDLINTSFYDLFRDNNIQSIVNRVEKSKTNIEGEIELKDGRVIPVLFSVSKIKGNDHENIGILCMVHNITERKKIEQELEQLVQKRTAELEVAKEQAEEADRLKSAFLANMSHEVRTPLNAIQGFAYLLPSQDLSEDKKTFFINQIQKNGDILVQLIDDIINLAKLESGQLHIQKEQVDIDQLLSDIATSYTETIQKNKQNQVRIIYNPPHQDSTYIKTDVIRIKQVILNLLNNAVKFTYEGYIEFGYSLQGDKIQFYVKDTGTGIPEDKQDKIFERFYKIEEQNTINNTRGTGLGLSISKYLVELLGGQIWFNSATNKGSTFYFTLPLENHDIQRKSFYPDEKTSSVHKDWSDKYILIAEDEYSNFILLEEMLADTQINIVHATNGKEALDLFHNNTFDAILMDIKMPEMDGVEALKTIKKTNSRIPVIAQTAYVAEEEKQKYFRAGFDDLIVKPLDMQNLYETMNKYLP